MTIGGIVLRVRLVGGDSMDVTYEHPDAASDAEVIDHVLATLSNDSGVLRCRHGRSATGVVRERRFCRGSSATGRRPVNCSSSGELHDAALA